MALSDSEMINVLFPLHLKKCLTEAESFLDKFNYNGLIIDSGVQTFYLFDDQCSPFQQNPYFSYWCFLSGDNHLILFEAGKKPCLYIFSPEDYWSDRCIELAPILLELFDIRYIRSLDEKKSLLKNRTKWVYLGNDTSLDSTNLDINPKGFLNAINWRRGVKSPYELYCIEQANKKASKAHLKVREAFINGASEYEIHMTYLSALKETANDLPYESIIALDEKAAILHYQYKRNVSNGNLLLIDAGAKFNEYCSDITRTYIQNKTDNKLFSDLISCVEKEQQNICSHVKKDISFKSLHHLWHSKLASILLESNILRNCSVEFAVKEGLTFTFCPHGLGHMLGIQVHDVSGLQENSEGKPSEKDKDYPKLRTVRKLREYEVITVEPGLYFIPMLLNVNKTTKNSEFFNWELIEKLTPLGGIRIEDNLVVREHDSLNLTRKFLDNTFKL